MCPTPADSRLTDTPEFAASPAALKRAAARTPRELEVARMLSDLEMTRELVQAVNETTRATTATPTIVAVTRMSLACRR